jgi:hypothetical protein
MALGAFTIVEQGSAQGPIRFVRATLVGDGAYPAGGSTGLLALVRAALGDTADILSVKDEGILADAVEYDHANEKLFVRVKATGVESAVSNQSGVTYSLFLIVK